MNLRGVFTAMITPFSGDRLDEEGLVQNIHLQLRAGVEGLVFLGSTGEAATLTERERARVIEIGVREARGRALVLIGTGSNATMRAIENTQRAKEQGADGALVVAPYYNRPTQEGIYRHFKAVATQVDLPLVIYNVPSRTGVNIETLTLLRLADLPNIAGVKEASGNLMQAADLLSHRPSFPVSSGDDAFALPMIALGGVGVISVISNLLPEQMVALVRYALERQFEKSRAIHEALFPLIRLLFIESNPIPIKEAMALCGMASGGCRLPLCEMRRGNRKELEGRLVEMQLR
jgi:4-hydroxy-tetrahydrodipicolinate synthase